MEWLKYTAELGHGSAQYILAQNYVHNGDTPSAIYWAKRSWDCGYPNGAGLVSRWRTRDVSKDTINASSEDENIYCGIPSGSRGWCDPMAQIIRTRSC